MYGAHANCLDQVLSAVEMFDAFEEARKEVAVFLKCAAISFVVVNVEGRQETV